MCGDVKCGGVCGVQEAFVMDLLMHRLPRVKIYAQIFLIIYGWPTRIRNDEALWRR